MKRKNMSFLAFAVILLSSTVVASQNPPTIYSQGTVEYDRDATIILRGIRIDSFTPPQDIESWVDSYVANHQYAKAVTLSDMHQYAVWWYGYDFRSDSGTWMGWTFSQLRTLLDRFHHYGWKVGLESTAIAWEDQDEYYYVQRHKEIAFTDANGMRATGIDDSLNFEKNPGRNKIIPDWFRNFTDSLRGITNQRLIDVYTTRLRQMVLDGLEWDFWFGTDGWNGLNLQGYTWSLSNKNDFYSHSPQEQSEWGNWTSSSMLPQSWNTMDSIARANSIIDNSTRLNNWNSFWQTRFSQLYAQIRNALVNAGRPGPFYLIGTVDLSSEPGSSGNLSPFGMWNITMLSKCNAVDYFYVDVESTDRVGAKYAIGREAAYAAALAKMQDPTVEPIIGLQPVDWTGAKRPLWEVKQSYLAQATNHIWFNGTRHRVSNPEIVMLQYPDDTGWQGWSKEEEKELFNWIEAMAHILGDFTPLWLGPTYPIPDTKSGALGSAWSGINFTFAQWVWTTNIRDTPNFVDQSMGTFFLDEALGDSGSDLQSLSIRMLDELWSNDKLNLWYYECRGFDWTMSSVWGTYANKAEGYFHIVPQFGNSTTYEVLGNLTDPVARWIASGYEGNEYSIGDDVLSYRGIYLPKQGFVSIVSFTHDIQPRIAAGYFQDASTGRFLLTHMPSGSGPQNYKKILPRSITNKMLYWVSKCPINSSEPLMDMKILNSSGAILIAMSNQRDVGDDPGSPEGWTLNATLSIDAPALSLGDPSRYIIYWASGWNGSNFYTTANWDKVQVSLEGMADVLVITPRNT